MGSYGLNDIFHVQTKKTKHRPRTADVDDTELEQIEDRRFFRRFFFFFGGFFFNEKAHGFSFFLAPIPNKIKDTTQKHGVTPKCWALALALKYGDFWYIKEEQ